MSSERPASARARFSRQTRSLASTPCMAANRLSSLVILVLPSGVVVTSLALSTDGGLLFLPTEEVGEEASSRSICRCIDLKALRESRDRSAISARMRWEFSMFRCSITYKYDGVVFRIDG